MAVFEQRDVDLAGRIGELTVPRAELTVETPALLPVINPHVRTVEPGRLGELGAQGLITNSYIFYGSSEFREPALEQGVHEVLGFDGAIMTDSGSFQLSEYGEIDVDTPEILRFQRDIGSDIATPVDIPTEPDADRDRVETELETTQDRLEYAADFDAGDMLVTAPVQGSTFPDLRERAAREAYATGLDVFPVGAMVPLLNEYRFDDVVEAVIAAKRGLGVDAPVHLFGAGHPMMFALAVALGCDLFDSAAYALYARDGRYLTVRGTKHLEDLAYFPCACPVCTEHEPDELAGMGDEERERLLAEHNLHVSFAEIDRIKQAIRDGDLLELLEERARAHPTLLDGYRTLLDASEWLERHDPVRKTSLFHLSEDSARRPEVARHHRRLERLAPPERVRLAVDPPAEEGANLSVWPLLPAFGPVPPALRQSYPFTATFPDKLDDAAKRRALEGVAAFASAHPECAVSIVADGWVTDVREWIPETVDVVEPRY